MESFLTMFGGITLSTLVTFLVGIGFAGLVIWKVYKAIIKEHDFWKKKEEQYNTSLEKMNKAFENQEEIKLSIDELKKEVKHIKERQNEIEEAQQNRELNKLRDRLLQVYRLHRNSNDNDWTQTEYESFMSMFQDYEDLGGNGHMHSVVYPYMMNLNVVPDGPTKPVQK